MLVLHGPDTAMRFPMTLLCQEQCTPAVTVLKDRGENFAFRFLCYVACILTWLRCQGFTLLDLGETNMGITMDSVASPRPVVRFFDALSWREEQRTDGKWSGFHNLAAKVCPTRSKWLKIAVADSGGDPKRAFLQIAAECQARRYRLMEAEAMANGSMSLEKVA